MAVLFVNCLAYSANMGAVGLEFIAILQACHRSHLFPKWFKNTLATRTLKIMNVDMLDQLHQTTLQSIIVKH